MQPQAHTAAALMMALVIITPIAAQSPSFIKCLDEARGTIGNFAWADPWWVSVL